jgi:hypothetical protein
VVFRLRASEAWTTSEVFLLPPHLPKNDILRRAISNINSPRTSMAACRSRLRTFVGSVGYTRTILYHHTYSRPQILNQNVSVMRIRGLATQPSANLSSKPYYVTTPIFYVNAGQLWLFSALTLYSNASFSQHLTSVTCIPWFLQTRSSDGRSY